MKSERLLKAIGEIDDGLINDALDNVAKKKKSIRIKWGAIAACLALAVAATAFLLPDVAPKQPIRTATVIYGDEGIPSTSYKTSLLYYTEDEMFAKEDMYIFRGTVLELKNVTIDFDGQKVYRCVAFIEINKVYKGSITAGQRLQMLLPCPILGEHKQEDTGVISQIKVGMEGIFMPYIYGEKDYMEANGAVMQMSDLAHCGLGDGMRWAFLETAHGLVFADFAYVGAASAKSLDDVEAYIAKMLDR